MSERHKVNCLICGAELRYETGYRPMVFALCGRSFESNVQCENGHYVCDACHSLLGGFCGFQGDCGAAVGVGIFISVMTGSTPLSVREWRLSYLATGRALITIAENGGPRCCKRNSFLALEEACKFVREQFDITLPVSQNVKCDFTDLNRQCIKEKCRYYTSGGKG